MDIGTASVFSWRHRPVILRDPSQLFGGFDPVAGPVRHGRPSLLPLIEELSAAHQDPGVVTAGNCIVIGAAAWADFGFFFQFQATQTSGTRSKSVRQCAASVEFVFHQI